MQENQILHDAAKVNTCPSFIVWQRVVVTFNMKTIVINQPWKEGHTRRRNEL
jgi:hypothetical protein